MIQIRRAVVLLFLFSFSSFAQMAWQPLGVQTLSLSTTTLNFGTKQTNTKDSLTFRVRNNGSFPLNVTDINTYKAAFTVRDTAFTILANDSATVKVYFQTNQNVTWNDILVVENTGGHGSLTLKLTGTGTYNEAGYASTQNLWEVALRTALNALVIGHTTLGYNTARDHMFETIDDRGVDTIECVYTGIKVYATTRTAAQNQNFNTEHTWPQSFFNSADPMVSDLNHLFPTDAAPNSARSNYPFGPVVSNITYNVGGSKLGHRADGAIAFEPRDVHKGDVARALLYFMVRHGNQGNYMDATQERDLRAWNKFDPVSTKEINRNNAIALPTNQNKRNPFIDHPEFADRITQLYTTAAPTLYSDIAVSPSTASFGSVAFNDSSEFNVIVTNRGRAALTISSVTLQNGSAAFTIVSSPSSVPVDSFAIVKVKLKPSVGPSYNDALRINSNDPDQPLVTVPLNGTAFFADVIVQVLLEGPYQQATGSMSTTLRTSGALVARYPGVAIPSDAVDSINIELRDSLSAASSRIRSYKAAWLLSTGFMVDFTDTTRPIRFDLPAGDYYVVVRHANHIPIMSSTKYNRGSLPSSYSFVTQSSNAYGFEPMKQVAPNSFAMYAGDANQSGIVNAADANSVFGALSLTGYSVLDVNLSGIISAADAGLVFDNLNRASQVP
jgi:endonuclease I